MALDALRLASAGDPTRPRPEKPSPWRSASSRPGGRSSARGRAARGSGPPTRRSTRAPADRSPHVRAAGPTSRRPSVGRPRAGREKNLRLVGPTRCTSRCASWARWPRPTSSPWVRRSGPVWPACRAGRVPARAGHRLVLAGPCPAAPGPRAECRGGGGATGHRAVVPNLTVPPRRSTATSPWPGSRAGWAPGAGRAGRIPFASTFAVTYVDLVASANLTPWATSTRRWRGRLSGARPESADGTGEELRDGCAMAAAACCWKAGVTSSAASVALRMLPHSMSTLGTVVRLSPARSLRVCRPSTPS